VAALSSGRWPGERDSIDPGDLVSPVNEFGEAKHLRSQLYPDPGDLVSPVNDSESTELSVY
jgi:hypothetical protein